MENKSHLVNYLAELIFNSLKKLTEESDLSTSKIAGLIGFPPNPEMGHFAFPCFPLAKQLKKSPAQISNDLKGVFLENEGIEELIVAGPYLNFKLKPNFLAEQVLKRGLSGDLFKIKTEAPRTQMYEYSQPNTHKELHVGHMRNLCLGNALVRLNQFIGHKVIPTTYPGDMGTHVAKCLWFLKYHNQEEAPKENKGPWLGRMYSMAAIKLEDEKGTEKEEQNRTELTNILKQLHQESGEYFELWKQTREWSIDLMNQAYNWADVSFDRWYFESEEDGPSLKFAKDLFNKGLLIKDDGAIGMDLKDDKLGFCILIKSDGNGMYSTKDISLAHKKFDEYGLDESFYIVDKRQAYHFKQVFKTLEKIGFPHAKNCEHLQYGFVELKEGAMSSRKGTIIPLMDLVSNMESMIKEKYLAKYSGDWDQAEIDDTAHKVANAAIKYGMLQTDASRDIVFDMEEWLKLDGETGPYLQYVTARINSMLEKFTLDESNMDLSKLSEKSEINLMLKVSEFGNTIVNAATSKKPSLLTSYLYELGKLFNSFYADCEIGKANDIELRNARLALSKTVFKTMKTGLMQLGITVPKRM